MAKLPRTKKMPQETMPHGREDERQHIKALLSAAGGYVPVLTGKSGVGKTAILDLLTLDAGKNSVLRVSAPCDPEQFARKGKSQWIFIDNAQRFNAEQFARVLDGRESAGAKSRMVLALDEAAADFCLTGFFKQYRFLKPVVIRPLDKEKTAALLVQFARERGTGLGHAAAMKITRAAADFFPERALPGAALEWLDMISAHSSCPAELAPGAIAEQLARLSGVDATLLDMSLAGRMERFLAVTVGQVDQLRLSQATKSMMECMISRLSPGSARRKPLGSFIIAGSDSVPVRALARLIRANCFGGAGAVLDLLLTGRSRQETPELITRMGQSLQDKSGGVIVMEGVEEAPVNFIEAMEDILEEGDHALLSGYRVDMSRTIFLFSTRVGESLVAHSGFTPSQLQKNVVKEVRTILPAPLCRRVDGIYLSDPA